MKAGESTTSGLTFAEIAEVLGISWARVQQIYARAIKKLVKAAKVRGLRAEDLPWGPR